MISSTVLPLFSARDLARLVMRPVMVEPGQTLLMRMFFGANSVAIVLERPITAVRAVFESARCAIGCLTEVETMLVMLPPPRASRWGIAARERRRVLIRLRLIASSHG